MNFHQVATEIMLSIEDEKWYETRDKIAHCLKLAQDYGEARGQIAARWIYPDRELWRDQPDGVR